MISVFVFFCFVSLASAEGEVEFLVPLTDSTYNTDGTISVEIKQVTPLADGDNTFKINFRICKAIFSDCYDQFQIIRVDALNDAKMWVDKSENLAFSFPCSHTWETSDSYVISIESTTTDFKARSEKFEIINNQGGISITRPTANAELTFGQQNEVVWSPRNIVGQDTGYVVNVLKSDGTPAFEVAGTVTSTSTSIVPTESWGGPGKYTIRVALASNGDIAASVDVNVKFDSAYFTITSPTAASVWTPMSMQTVSWTATNVMGDQIVELFYGDSAMQALGTVPAGMTELRTMALPTLQTSFAYRIRISGMGPGGAMITSFSEPFLFQGMTLASSGLCRIDANSTRSATCKRVDGMPLYETGPTFKVFVMQFIWQTCVSVTGTTLDVNVQYQDSTGMKTAGINTKNFLPTDGDKDIIILNGVNNPNYLALVMRQVVLGTKVVGPPGMWSFTTNLFITNTRITGTTRGAELPLAMNLMFSTTNPDCIVGGKSTIPGCVTTSAAGCMPRAMNKTTLQPQKLFEAGAKLCSSTKYVALEKPCGEMALWTYSSSAETVRAVSGMGQPCNTVFYVEVNNELKKMKGFVPASTIQACPAPRVCNAPLCKTPDGGCNRCSAANSLFSTTSLVVVALSSAFVSLFF